MAFCLPLLLPNIRLDILLSTNCSNWCLHFPDGSGGLADGNGSELPKLEVEGAAVRKTDECGRAFFGDVSLGEGSGRVAPDENAGGNARQGGAIELVLVAEVAGLGTADTKCVSRSLPFQTMQDQQFGMYYSLLHVWG